MPRHGGASWGDWLSTFNNDVFHLDAEVLDFKSSIFAVAEIGCLNAVWLKIVWNVLLMT